MNLYPVNLDIRERICLIIGGGEVAARKIGPLVSCGARVEVISPHVVSVIEELARSGSIVWQCRTYRFGDMDGAFLVFIATDDRQAQASIGAEAKEKGILANSADDPAACAFQVPARVRRGRFLLTVSTGGGSPALAAKLRRELEMEYGSEYQAYVDLLAKIRKKVVSDGQSQASHKRIFEKLLQLNIPARIRQEDWRALQDELRTILPSDLDVDELVSSIQQAATPEKTKAERAK